MNNAAFVLGKEIHFVDEETIIDSLQQAAREARLHESEILPTITSGLNAGKKQAVDPTQGWRAGLLYSETNIPLKCPGNVIASFRHPDIEGLLALDERFCQVVLNNTSPWEKANHVYPRDWSEPDNIWSLEWLSRVDPPIIGMKNWTQDAALAISREQTIHPTTLR